MTPPRPPLPGSRRWSWAGSRSRLKVRMMSRCGPRCSQSSRPSCDSSSQICQSAMRNLVAKRGAETVANEDFVVRAVSPRSLLGGLERRGPRRRPGRDRQPSGGRPTSPGSRIPRRDGRSLPVDPRESGGRGNRGVSQAPRHGYPVRVGSRRYGRGRLGPVALPERGRISAGVDEVNVGPIPVQLAHREVADIVLSADGLEANTVQVAFTPTGGEWVTFSNQISRLFQGALPRMPSPRRGRTVPPDRVFGRPPDWAPLIQHAVAERAMPPWKPVPGHGEFEGGPSAHRRGNRDGDVLGGSRGSRRRPRGPSRAPGVQHRLVNGRAGPDSRDSRLHARPAIDGRLPMLQCSDSRQHHGEQEHCRGRGPAGNRKIVHHLILFGDPVGEVGLRWRRQPLTAGRDTSASAAPESA